MFQARTIVQDGTRLIISRPCNVTHQTYTVTVEESAWDGWLAGTVAQKAFPTLTPDQREFLISDTTPAEWEALFFGPEPTDDDDESDVHDPSAENHVLPSDLDPDTDTAMVANQLACQCCGDREATIHEASASFCPTCYEAGAARDDRDQS